VDDSVIIEIVVVAVVVVVVTIVVLFQPKGSISDCINQILVFTYSNKSYNPNQEVIVSLRERGGPTIASSKRGQKTVGLIK
jgi:hypothetical protein